MAKTNTFYVATWNDRVLIKVEGNATMHNSLLFKGIVDEMLEKKVKEFIIDLSQCTGMDSTFIGVLGGIASLSEKSKETSPKIIVINLTPYLRNLLDSLGISEILTIKNNIEVPNIATKAIQAKSPYQDTKKRMTLIKEAHEYLVSLNEKNKKLFQDFLDMLEAEQEG